MRRCEEVALHANWGRLCPARSCRHSRGVPREFRMCRSIYPIIPRPWPGDQIMIQIINARRRGRQNPVAQKSGKYAATSQPQFVSSANAQTGPDDNGYITNSISAVKRTVRQSLFLPSLMPSFWRLENEFSRRARRRKRSTASPIIVPQKKYPHRTSVLVTPSATGG